MAQGTSKKSSPANVNAVDITSNSSSDSVSLVNGLVRLQYFESILQDSIKVSVIYSDTGNSINGQSVIEGLPLIGTEDVLSNQYKQARFQLTNVGFHVSYYADIPVYTWDYDEERDEFEDRFDEHSFSTIKKLKVDLKKQLLDSFVNNLEKNKKDIYEESEVTVLINNYKFQYKCNLNSIKEFEINKDSTRDEVIAFGKKYNLLEDFIRTWII